MHARAVLLISLTTLCLTHLGCASGKGAGRTVADAILPPRQEIELGKQMSAEVEQDLKLLDNPAITAWVKRIGISIAKAGRKDIPKGIQFTFKVVDDDETVNAFALPGGYIYVYTGLLKKAENESEIAAVMGHEISHVTRRHIAQRLTAMYGISALASVALGKNPGLLAELVANVAANGYLLKHSRDAERDSDAYGMRYMVAAGYSPVGYATFFTKLAQSPSPPAIVSSHPNPRERVANAQKRIARYNSKVRGRSVGKQAYDEQMAALK
jgi:predicted Zn-dependent protease